MCSTSSKSRDTRQCLLNAALHAFGQKDFDGVSTRQIVEAAEVNIAAISYHFGSKQDLYLATASYLADNLYQGIAPLLLQVERAIPGAGPAQCRRMLSDLVTGFAENLLTGPLGEDAPGFIFREQNHPTKAFDLLYDKLFRPLHGVMVKLVAGVRRVPPDAPEVIYVAHALLGPAIAFRAARTTMLRHLSRTAYTSADLIRIRKLVAALTDAAIGFDWNDLTEDTEA